jgi:UDP-N-acetylglucosamine--N-acetylmuramyl-(pentapeptide) pyrophosphoryl-undecaprenol N-acetylglucosamine transferase
MQPKADTHSTPLRVLVSGGGTGGHIFPAIAIADELKRLRPDTEFLFVGARGKMEMDKVPQAGYEIRGLWISGLKRSLSLDNLSFPFKVLHSLWTSRSIIRNFKPNVAVGTGGYAGGPALYAAAKLGVPTLIQEPNAFAGLANKWLGKHMDKICVAFEGMQRYFPADKLVITGNPVRESMLQKSLKLSEDRKNSETKAVFLMGGSGGARSLNEALRDNTEALAARPQVQWLWQCGKNYYDSFKDCASAQLPNVTITAFVDDMAEAYANADVVIGRAGSTTIAEVQYLGKAAIFVPSPWVTEDHQTKNVLALTAKDAAVYVKDVEAMDTLMPAVFELLDDDQRRMALGQRAAEMAQRGAVNRIAQEVLNLIPSPTPTTA